MVHLVPLQIGWYGLLIASAVLLETNLSQAFAKRRGIQPEILSELVIWLVIAFFFVPIANCPKVGNSWAGEYLKRSGDGSSG